MASGGLAFVSGGGLLASAAAADQELRHGSAGAHGDQGDDNHDEAVFASPFLGGGGLSTLVMAAFSGK
jgi:hypothetical protein